MSKQQLTASPSLKSLRFLDRLIRLVVGALLDVVMRVLKVISMSLFEWRETFFCALPDSFFGKKLRSLHYALKFRLNHFPAVYRMAKIYGDKRKLFLGKRFECGEYVEINFCRSNGLYIGNDVAIAQGSYIRAGNHKFDRLDMPINKQGHEAASILYKGKEYSIVIEDDVWIGAKAIILSGTKIGTGSVVAAGAVVSIDVPPYSVVAGNPARIIMSRKENG